MARSAIAYMPVKGELGRVYVGFGADRDQGIWHGWLFEVDLEAWRRTSGQQAVRSVLLTTPVDDCSEEKKDCGGGIWAYDGPQVYQSRSGYEVLVQTGNGRLDLSKGSYAQSLLRLSPGLKFAPKCSVGACESVNPLDPSSACLETCENLFVPRLLPGEPNLSPVDRSCEGKSFLQCLDVNDWDFGGGSPLWFSLEGQNLIITASKAGGVYLLDGDRMGLMYDAKQAGLLCGTVASPCPAPWEGISLARPTIVRRAEQTIALVPTYNYDSVSPAGVVAYAIEGSPQPKMREIWRAPSQESKEAIKWFREPPTRLILTSGSEHDDPIAWIADNSAEGRLLGIRVSDGKVLANLRTAGRPSRNARPESDARHIYLPTVSRDGLAQIEVFDIRSAGRVEKR